MTQNPDYNKKFQLEQSNAFRRTAEITDVTLIADMRRQAQWLFFIAILGITICIVIYLIGATTLILGKTSTGVFTTIASSLSTLPFIGMVKTSHNWLRIAKKELQVQLSS